MARDPHPVTLDDDALLAAITASLETSMRHEPSADFLARVRDQFARERAHPAARKSPTWFAVAATVPIALAVAAALVGRLTLPLPEDGTPVPSEAPTARVTDVSPRTSLTRPAAPVTRKKPRRGRAGGKADILVEPGQMDALVRMATGGATARFEFVVYGLEDTAVLPALQPTELPRFEARPLQVSQPPWNDLTTDGEAVNSDGNEGSEP